MSGDSLFVDDVIMFVNEISEIIAFERAVIQLLQFIDDTLEEYAHFFETAEAEIHLADLKNQFKHISLARYGRHGIYRIKGILLENNEIDNLCFPEVNMILKGYTIVTQNVNLIANFPTPQQNIF